MSEVMELDLGPLTWVKSEIDLALSRAAEALSTAAANPATADTQVQFAQTHLHQACGALSIVGLDGLTQFTSTLEQLLGEIARGELPAEGAVLALCQRCLAATGNYLEELVHGTPDQPLRLMPLYTQIAAARKQPAPSGSELFFPDLSRRPARRATANLNPAIFEQELKRCIAQYQRGLLKVLRGEDTQGGAKDMLQVAQSLEKLHPQPSGATFWWVAQAFFEGLANGSLQPLPLVKKLCSALERELRTHQLGQSAIPERLLRELLFHIAHTKVSTETQRKVQDIWQLEALIPEEGAAVSSVPLAPLLKVLRTELASSKRAWDEFSSGKASALPTFQTHLSRLAEQARQLYRPALDRLLNGMELFAQWLRKDPLAFNEVVAIETASAQLLIEAALSEGGPEVGFAGQVSDTLNRLSALTRGEQLPRADQSATVRTARRGEEREALSQVGREILSNLAHIEQRLDDFFRNQAKRAPLAGLNGPLKQIEGALFLIGDEQATELVRNVSTTISALAEGTQEAETGTFEELAQKLSALGFYVQSLQHGPATLAQFLDPQAARAVADASAAEDTISVSELETEGDSTPVAEQAKATQHSEPITTSTAETVAPPPAVSATPPSAPQAAPTAPSPAAPAPESEAADEALDAELLEIFIEEAHDVLGNLDELLQALRSDPHDGDALTSIRRGFHTLKGSGRMVGLTALGEVAWAVEQTMNRWLHMEWLPTPALFAMIEQAIAVFNTWATQIENGGGVNYDAAELVALAETLREQESADATPVVTASAVAEETVATEEASELPAVEPVAVQAAEAEIATSESAATLDGDEAASQENAAEPETAEAGSDLELTTDDGAPLASEPATQGEAFVLAEAEIPAGVEDASATAQAEPASVEDLPTEVIKPYDPTASQLLEIPLEGDDEMLFAEDFGTHDLLKPDEFMAAFDEQDGKATSVDHVLDADTTTSLDVSALLNAEAAESDSDSAFDSRPPAADETTTFAGIETLAEPLLFEEDAAEATTASPAAQEPNEEEITSALLEDEWLAAEPASAPEPAAQADTPAAPTIEWDDDTHTDDFNLFETATEVSADPTTDPAPAPSPALEWDDDAGEITVNDVTPQAEDLSTSATEAPITRDTDAEAGFALDLHSDADDTDTEDQTAVAATDATEEPLDIPASAAVAADVTEQDAEDAAEHVSAGEEAAEPAPEPAVDAVPEEAAPDVARIGDVELSRTLFDLFIGEAEQHIATLHEELGQLRANPTRIPSEPALRAAHTLASISGTARVQSMFELGRSFEYAIERLRSNSLPPRPDQCELLSAVVDRLDGMLTEATIGIMPLGVPEYLDALQQVGELPEDPYFSEPLALEGLDVQDLSAADAIAALSDDDEDSAPTEISDPAAELAPVEPVEDDSSLAPVDEASAAELTTNEVPAIAPAAATTAADSAPSFTPAAVHDDIDDQLLPIFLEEAEELISQLHGALRKWSDEPDNEEQLKATARLLHTLKGSARMTGAMTLGEFVHQLETHLEAGLTSNRARTALIDDITNGVDHAEQVVDALSRGETPPEFLPSANDDDEITAVETTAAPTSAAAAAPAKPTTDKAKAGDSSSEVGGGVIRVKAELVDRFVNEAGEIGIARTRIEGELRTLRRSLLDLTENVIRLRNQLREVEIQAEVQMQTRIAQAEQHHADFDPLEMDRYTRLQELTRLMAESVGDVTTVQQNLLRNLDGAELALHGQARLSRDLQQALMQVRMVPFDSLADRLYRIVRQSAKELGKRVNLDIRGGRIEIDRSVLERMTAPLEHLLRNAIAHGIETPEVRREQGKDETGQLTITVSHEANEILLVMADDGKGLNYEAILARARARSLLEEGETPDTKRLTNMIFVPGFSTAESVSQVSGRGVGMDVVKSETAAVGGRIDVASTPQQGTEFRIYLPLTLAVTQAVLVRAGQHTYAIPSSMVAQVMELKEAQLQTLREQGGIDWNNERFNYRYLPRLLGDMETQPEPQRFNWVLLLRAGAQTLALHVDSLRGNQEIVVKNAGPQLVRIIGITGATVLGDGEIVLILNPVALASRYLDRSSEEAAAEAQVVTTEPVERVPTIMIVDDSLTVRKITGRLLEREGYRVITAKDGSDALEKLVETLPDVILSDIEMPRMDGFDLVRNIRADERTRDIPVIMITSRLAEKHRQYALKVGANHYLGKPFEEEELLGLLEGYTQHIAQPA